jgi:hypothetical protein
MLARVLHGLQAAEVDRGLDVGRVPAERAGLHPGRQRAVAGRGEQRIGQPVRPQQRRVDPVREAAQLPRGVPDLGAELLQQAGQVRVPPGQLRGHQQLDRQAGQLLLGAVVQVALDAPALRVGGGHDARPRGPQLVVLAAQLIPGIRQGGIDQGGHPGQRLRNQARAPPGTR